MKVAFSLAAISVLGLVSACSSNVGTNNAASPTVPNSNSASPSATQSGTVSTANETKAGEPSTKCPSVEKAGKRFIAKQSFAFDFEPFKEACFVTFGSTEKMLDEKDVPRGSTFYIYQNGKQVFEFPDAFDGQPGCWVDGVGFSDLNGDGKTDVIMAGSCLAARDSYPSNAVYVNTGKGFTTSAAANEKIQDLKSVDAIKAFVKKDVKSFF